MLMPKDDFVRVVFEVSRADETPARAALGTAWDGVFLRIRVEGSNGILHDNMVGNPVVEHRGGAGINVVLRGIIWIRAALLYNNQIVGVGSVILLLLGRGNLVVGLRKDAVEGSGLGVIAIGVKRVNA